MRLLIAIATLTLPLTSASAERTRPMPRSVDGVPMQPCQDLGVQHARKDGKGEVKRLGELPPGDLVLTVMQGTGRCFRPVIVRRGIGAAGEEAEGAPLPQRRVVARTPKLIR